MTHRETELLAALKALLAIAVLLIWDRDPETLPEVQKARALIADMEML